MNKQNKQKQKNKNFKNSWIRPCREITFFFIGYTFVLHFREWRIQQNGE